MPCSLSCVQDAWHGACGDSIQEEPPDVGLAPSVATLQSPQRSSWALRAQELETELKMSSRGLPAPGSKKLKTESKKSRKRVEISIFRLFFDSVFNFLDPGAGRPRELIFNSVSNFGPEGPKNSSGGIEGSLPKCPLAAPPQSTKGPFPRSTSLPYPLPLSPPPPSFPTPSWLLLQCSGRAQPGRAWARDPVAQQGCRGGPSNQHLGPDPHLGALDPFKKSLPLWSPICPTIWVSLCLGLGSLYPFPSGCPPGSENEK